MSHACPFLGVQLTPFPSLAPACEIDEELTCTQTLTPRELLSILQTATEVRLNLNEHGLAALNSFDREHDCYRSMEAVSPDITSTIVNFNNESTIVQSDREDSRVARTHPSGLKYKKVGRPSITNGFADSLSESIFAANEAFSGANESNLQDDVQEYFAKLIMRAETCEPFELRKAIIRLASEVCKLRASGSLNLLPKDLLKDGMNVLERYIGNIGHPHLACKREVTGQTNGKDALSEEAEAILDTSMQATIAVIIILAEAVASVFCEDSLLNALDVLKLYVGQIGLPTHEQTSNEAMVGGSANGKGAKSAVAKKKRKEMEQIRDSAVFECARRCAPVGEALSILTELVQRQTLQDRELLRLTQLCLGTFFHEGAEAMHALQQSSISLLQAVFAKYHHHRKDMFDELFARTSSWQPVLKHEGCYRIPPPASGHIQMLSALLLHLLQSCCCESSAVSQDASGSRPDVGSSVMKELLFGHLAKMKEKFMAAEKSGRRIDRDGYCAFLQHFTADVCTVLALPEWPVASLAFRVLWKNVYEIFAKESFPMVHRQIAVDLLCGMVDTVISLQIGTCPTPAKVSRTMTFELAEFIPKLKDQHCYILRQLGDELGMDMPLESSQLSTSQRDRVACQQLLLNYLTRNSRSDGSVANARHCYISDWVGTEWKQEASNTVSSCFASQRALPSDWVVFDRFCVPQPHEAMEIARELTVTGDHIRFFLTDNFKQLLMPLLALLKHPRLPNFRQRALKALSVVVAKEPSILSQDIVSRAVCDSMSDEAKSVRAAAVSLVGTYMCQRTDLTLKYYEGICRLCRDSGTSVRKAAMQILRECLLREDLPRRVAEAACVAIVPLLKDESQDIRNKTAAVLRDLWFPAHLDKDTCSGEGLAKALSVETRFEQINGVVAAAHSDTYTTNRDSLTVTDILEGFLREVMAEIGGGGGGGSGVGAGIGAAAYHRRLCEAYCQHGVQLVIREHEACELEGADGEEAVLEERLLGLFRTLALFTRAHPSLLVKDAGLLHQYLSVRRGTDGGGGKGSGTNSAVRFQLTATVASIYECVLPHMRSMPASLINYLREDLLALIQRAPKVELLAVSVRCLCSMVLAVATQQPHNAAAMAQMLERSFRPHYDASLRRGQEVAARRSLIIAGLYCRHASFALPVAPRASAIGASCVAPSAVGDEHVRALCDACVKWFVQHSDRTCRSAGYQCLGNLFVRAPALLLDPVVAEAVGKAFDKLETDDVCLYALRALGELVETEGAEGTCLRNAVMQRFLDRVLSCVYRVNDHLALAAVTLVRHIHDRGQVHPKLCIADMLACQQRSAPCRAVALQVLLNITEKYPEYFSPEVFIEGVLRAFDFHRPGEQVARRAFGQSFTLQNRGNFAQRLLKHALEKVSSDPVMECASAAEGAVLSAQTSEVVEVAAGAKAAWSASRKVLARRRYLLMVILCLPCPPEHMHEFARAAGDAAVQLGTGCLAEMQAIVDDVEMFSTDPRGNMQEQLEVATVVRLLLESKRKALALFPPGSKRPARPIESDAEFCPPLAVDEYAEWEASGPWLTAARRAVDALSAELRKETRASDVSEEAGDGGWNYGLLTRAVKRRRPDDHGGYHTCEGDSPPYGSGWPPAHGGEVGQGFGGGFGSFGGQGMPVSAARGRRQSDRVKTPATEPRKRDPMDLAGLLCSDSDFSVSGSESDPDWH